MQKQYRPATGLANGVTLFLAVFGVIVIASMILTIAEIGLLRRIENGDFVSVAEVASNENRQGVIYRIYIAAFVVSAIAFLVWIKRASENLAALGVDNQTFSPGSAVVWWFIPVMSLLLPCRVMIEIWKGSYPVLGANGLSSWADAPVSGLLGLWWVTWLLSWWGSNVANWIFLDNTTIRGLIVGDILIVVSNAILLVSLVLVLMLVQQITANQSSKHATYQDLIEAGRPSDEAAAETAQDLPLADNLAPPARPACQLCGTEREGLADNLAPPARPARKARCLRCRNAMVGQESDYVVCIGCRGAL